MFCTAAAAAAAEWQQTLGLLKHCIILSTAAVSPVHWNQTIGHMSYPLRVLLSSGAILG